MEKKTYEEPFEYAGGVQVALDSHLEGGAKCSQCRELRRPGDMIRAWRMNQGHVELVGGNVCAHCAPPDLKFDRRLMRRRSVWLAGGIPGPDGVTESTWQARGKEVGKHGDRRKQSDLKLRVMNWREVREDASTPLLLRPVTDADTVVPAGELLDKMEQPPLEGRPGPEEEAHLLRPSKDPLVYLAGTRLTSRYGELVLAEMFATNATQAAVLREIVQWAFDHGYGQSDEAKQHADMVKMVSQALASEARP